MHELGAAGRYVLERTAARKWEVGAGEVYAKHYRLDHILQTSSRIFRRARRRIRSSEFAP